MTDKQASGGQITPDDGPGARAARLAKRARPAHVIHAVPFSTLRFATFDANRLAKVPQSTSERATARYVHARAELAFSAAYLEGNTFTLPEVRTLLGGETPANHTEAEIEQILALTEAAEALVSLVTNRRFRLQPGTADAFNGILAGGEALDAGTRRHRSSINPDGQGATVNVMGETFIGYTKSDLADLEQPGYTRISSIKHPVERALNFAAFASYAQFYLDGNKRTARYLMDGELMSYGYDAVLIPALAKPDYNDALAAMFRSGNLQPYAEFLLATLEEQS